MLNEKVASDCAGCAAGAWPGLSPHTWSPAAPRSDHLRQLFQSQVHVWVSRPCPPAPAPHQEEQLIHCHGWELANRPQGSFTQASWRPWMPGCAFLHGRGTRALWCDRSTSVPFQTCVIAPAPPRLTSHQLDRRWEWRHQRCPLYL